MTDKKDQPGEDAKDTDHKKTSKWAPPNEDGPTDASALDSTDSERQSAGDDVSSTGDKSATRDQVEAAEAESAPEKNSDVEAHSDGGLDAPGLTESASAVEQGPMSTTEGQKSEVESMTSELTPSEADETEATEAQPPPQKKPGRVLASFALLLALLGVGGVGYLYYTLIYQDPLAQLAEKDNQVGAQYQALSEQLREQVNNVRAETEKTLTAASEEQAARLANSESQVVKSLNDALKAAPPSQREWKLAEAEYLLRIANHRVLMEQDSKGALNLLTAADAVLKELDDYSLHQVRARLADEIVALKQVRRDDLQGIYLRLEALKGLMDQLPIRVPEFATQQRIVPPEQTVWQTLWEELKQFVRIRTLETDETIKPLLAPEEERFLELNLRLSLQQAQLAALKRHQAVYETSLTSARTWIAEYMAEDSSTTTAILSELDELTSLELARPLPDVSGSLNELLNLGRGAP